MELNGILAVVTGGGSGLGEATARRLVSNGASVAIFDLAASRGEEIAQELGSRARFFDVDVTLEERVQGGLDGACEAFGTPRLLVNCAGIGPPAKVLGRDGTPSPLDFFEKVVRVNLIGSFNTTRLTASRMAAGDPLAGGERGVVVNTASVAAFEGQIGQAAYSASKAGIVGMTLPIARELAALGIRCCSIAPGLFETPMLMGLPEKARESLASSIPFPTRLGRPDEYAALACHIAENPMLNGETIRLDGAIRMAPR